MDVTAMVAAALAWAGLAAGQSAMPLPQEDGSEIYACGHRIVRPAPSEAALALGRRLAEALDGPAIAARVLDYLSKADPPPVSRRPGAGGRSAPCRRLRPGAMPTGAPPCANARWTAPRASMRAVTPPPNSRR